MKDGKYIHDGKIVYLVTDDKFTAHYYSPEDLTILGWIVSSIPLKLTDFKSVDELTRIERIIYGVE